MQSTLVDITSYLQLCSAELFGCYTVIQAKFKMTCESAASTTGLLILFFLMKHSKLSITYLV